MSIKQELFDRISKHLLKQNAKSIDIGGCLYRGPNGLKCAVGAIIPDKKYSQTIEGSNVHDTEVVDCLPTRYQGDNSIEFLYKLQKLHDCAPVDLWKQRLEEIAKDEGLVVNF